MPLSGLPSLRESPRASRLQSGRRWPSLPSRQPSIAAQSRSSPRHIRYLPPPRSPKAVRARLSSEHLNLLRRPHHQYQSNLNSRICRQRNVPLCRRCSPAQCSFRKSVAKRRRLWTKATKRLERHRNRQPSNCPRRSCSRARPPCRPNLSHQLHRLPLNRRRVCFPSHKSRSPRPRSPCALATPLARSGLARQADRLRRTRSSRSRAQSLRSAPDRAYRPARRKARRVC